MLRRLILTLALLAISLPVSAGRLTLLGAGAPPSGFTPACSQSTDFIARTSGLSDVQKARYDTLICGLETDGIGCSTTLDALYILAAPDATTSLLNLCSATYALTNVNASTFTANQGYAGNGTTSFLNTNFNASTASSPRYVQNSASFGHYSLTSDATGGGIVDMSAGGPSASILFTLFAAQSFLNLNSATGLAVASTNSQGMWISSRTTSTAFALYKNGSSVATDTDASDGVPDSIFAIGAYGQPADSAINFSTHQNAAAFIGSELDATQASNMSARINTFMTALGINVY